MWQVDLFSDSGRDHSVRVVEQIVTHLQSIIDCKHSRQTATSDCDEEDGPGIVDYMRTNTAPNYVC